MTRLIATNGIAARAAATTLPRTTAHPSHMASSATYMGLRLNAYGPRRMRSFGVQSSATRSGRSRAWRIPVTITHTSTAKPAATGIRPRRFHDDVERGPRRDSAHGTSANTAGATTRNATGATATDALRDKKAGTRAIS